MERGVDDMMMGDAAEPMGDAAELHQARLGISMAASLLPRSDELNKMCRTSPDDLESEILEIERRAMVEDLVSGLLSVDLLMAEPVAAGLGVTAEEQQLFDALSMRFPCRWVPKPPGKPTILIQPGLCITYPYVPGSVDVIAGVAEDPAASAQIGQVRDYLERKLGDQAFDQWKRSKPEDFQGWLKAVEADSFALARWGRWGSSFAKIFRQHH